MGGGRFEEIVRSLAAAGTRRGVVRGGLLAIGLGAAGFAGIEEDARARKRRRRRRRRGGGAGLGSENCTVCEDKGECPFTSVQAAINAATAGDTITICKGSYKEDLTVSKSLTLVAEEVEAVELEGTGATSVISVPAGVTAEVRGFLIVDGIGTLDQGVRSGGAIYNRGELTVVSTFIQDNQAAFGGAVFNATGAKLTLDNTTIESNDATSMTANTFGGAIYNRFGAEVNMVNGSRLAENEASNGGAIYNNGILNITDGSTIAANKADLSGGAILNDEGIITIDASSVVSNKAKFNGGGIQNFNGRLTIRNNSEIGGNEAENGGGVYNQAPATMTVIDSAITNNDADELGGGIFNGGGTVSLQSSTVFENEAGATGGGIFNTQGGVVTLDSQSAVVDNKPNNCVGTNACGA